MTEGARQHGPPPPASTDVQDVLLLIDEKYRDPRNLLIDREIFVKGIASLQECQDCIWCQQGRISGELLRLLSFQDNECSRWFREKTQLGLSSCPDCLEAYYQRRPELKRAFSAIYEPETLGLFWQKVSDFDTDRIHQPLRAFIAGEADAKSTPLLFALYELLLFPAHLSAPLLHRDFVTVLRHLVDSRKMIKLSRLLPGVFVCLVDGEEEGLRRWASSMLSAEKLEPASSFIPGSFDLSRVLQSAFRLPAPHETLLQLVQWLPASLDASDLHEIRLFSTARLAKDDDSSFEPALYLANALYTRFPPTAPHNWAHFEEALFGAAPLYQLLRTRRLDVSRYFSCFQCAPKGARWDAQARLVEKLIILFTATATTAGAEGDFSASNIVEIVLYILSGPAFKELLSTRPFKFYRLLSLTVQRVLEARLGEGTIPSAITEICWRIDGYFVEKGENDQFRGFGQLLVSLIKSEPVGRACMLALLSKLGARPWQLAAYLERRLFILSAVREQSDVGLFSHSDSHATVVLLACSACNSEDSPWPKDFLQSYPERFSHAFAGVLKVLAGVKSTETSVRMHDGALKLFEKTFLSGFFVEEDQTIVDLFPARPLILASVALSGLALSLATLKSVPAPNRDRGLFERLSSLIEFSARVYYKQPAGEGRLRLLGENLDVLSVLVENLAKSYCTKERPAHENTGKAFALLIEGASSANHVIDQSAQKMLGIMHAQVRLGSAEKTILNAAIDGYEKRIKHPLPRPPKDPEAVLPAEPTKLRCLRDTFQISDEIEAQILDGMHNSNVARKEKSLPIAIRSNVIRVAPKPASKVDQLRAEVVRSALPTASASNSRKRAPHASLNVSAKPPKLDLKASSTSDSEDDENDYSTFKERFSKLKKDAEPVQESRSVKLINITDASSGEKKGQSKRNEYYLALQEVNMCKQFHRKILQFKLDDSESIPEDGTISAIPGAFESAAHYTAVFEPLLYAECRAQVMQSLKEIGSVDNQSLRISAVRHLDELHEIVLQVDADRDQEGARLNDQDYLRLSFPSCKDRLYGVVAETTVKAGMLEAVVRLLVPATMPHMQVELREGLVVKVKKVCSLITNVREFTAMNAVETLRLGPLIFNPKLQPATPSCSKEDLRRACRSLSINESQAKAIFAVVNNVNPITLIQGPPGTGKTKTIEALLALIYGRAATTLPSRSRTGKVLICAPSNAAIDEIVRRIRGGVVDANGERTMVKVLRVGSLEMIAEEVKDLTIDRRVEKLIASSMDSSRKLLEEQRRRCSELGKQLDGAEGGGKEEEARRLKNALWEAKESMRRNIKFVEDTKTVMRKKVLEDCQIICCTLSSSGHDLISRVDFEYVIIDEACQAVELSCLVPLQHNCRQCVLIGDPNQLPPTVLSQMAGVFLYEQSLFVRLQKQCPESVHLLDTQYRMHPEISRFPNDYFYSGRLIDGPLVESANRRAWHRNHLLGPFRFFDVAGREDAWRHDPETGVGGSKSKMNELETIVASNLIAMLCTECPDLAMAGRIGLITPYKDQKRALRREIGDRFGGEALQAMEISTVDGYQGQEREVIIFSCVRTGENRGIGFLNDTRRLNVALTRAKCSLFVLGSADTLVRNPIWRALIEEAKNRKSFVTSGGRMWEGVSQVRSVKNLTCKPAGSEGKAAAPAAKTPSMILTPVQRILQGQQQAVSSSSAALGGAARTAVEDILDRPPAKASHIE